MRKTKLTNKPIIAIICIALFVGLIVGTAFAYYEMNYRGFAQEYSTMRLTFFMNGHAYTVVGDNEVNLTRGSERELTLEVAAIGKVGGNFVMQYRINFDLNGDNVKARGIQVHQLVNGEYQYKCQLSEIGSYVIESYLDINSTYEYNFKLVYPASAGDYFEKQSFTLTATSDSWLTAGEKVFND